MTPDLTAVLTELLAEVRELRRALVTQSRPELAERLTIDEAAEVLGCSRETVFDLLRSGEIVRAPKKGRRTFITRASVLAALEPKAPKAPRARSKARRSDAEELEAIRRLADTL